jgi:hypothetical protein
VQGVGDLSSSRIRLRYYVYEGLLLGGSMMYLALFSLGTALLIGRGPVEPVGPNNFATLLDAIRPKPGSSAWLKIPWQTSLAEARKKAAAEGKPVLLWEMDGNPLGCG